MYYFIPCLKITPTKTVFLFISLASLLLGGCGGPTKQSSTQRYVYSGDKSALIAKAHLLLGTPYRYGGSHPSTGFDCSGFVQYTHASVGIRVPRTSKQQHQATKPIRKHDLRPGDLVFFRINRKRTISHVGIYIGKGKFIHAPSTGKRVSIARLDNPYWQRNYNSAGRIF